MQVLKTFLTIFLFTLLSFAVFTLVTSKSAVPGGIRSFTVVSGSMQPSLPVGSIVYVQKSPTYQLGNIISFQENNTTTVTHRVSQTIIKGGQIFYQTKGDANKSPDSKLITASEITGKEILAVPYVGYLSGFLKTLPGFLALIILPTLIFIGSEIWNIKKELTIPGTQDVVLSA